MTRKTCPDFALILRNSGPSPKLHDQIVGCFYEELRRISMARCKDQSLAEEAAQDAVVASIESLSTFRGDAPIEHWLRRLVVSSCSRLRRGRKNSPSYNRPLDEAPAPRTEDLDHNPQEARVLLGERLALLRDVLSEIPEDNRTMLLLHEGQEVSIEDLANRFGLTKEGVKARLKRTRAKARERLIVLAEGGDP